MRYYRKPMPCPINLQVAKFALEDLGVRDEERGTITVHLVGDCFVVSLDSKRSMPVRYHEDGFADYWCLQGSARFHFGPVTGATYKWKQVPRNFEAKTHEIIDTECVHQLENVGDVELIFVVYAPYSPVLDENERPRSDSPNLWTAS